MQARETKRNGTVYDVVFRVVDPLTYDEKQKKLSGFKSKALAKKAYLDFVTTKCEIFTKNPVRKKSPSKQTPTVGELVPEYIASLGNQNKGSTIYDKENIYRLYVLPTFRDTPVDKLSKEALYKWQDALWAMRKPDSTYYSFKYLHKVKTHFNAFLAWCEKRYEYPNRLSEVETPKKRPSNRVMKIWTREDFERFAAVIDNDPVYKCLFTMLFFTGKRIGEMLAVRAENVSEDLSTLRISESVTRKTKGKPYEITSTKADKAQELPLCPRAQAALAEYRAASPNGEFPKPFLFYGSRPLPDNSIRRRFQHYCDKAGVQIIRIHDLRHSFASMIIHEGANLTVVADLLGDTLEQVTKTYAHVYEMDKKTVLSRLV